MASPAGAGGRDRHGAGAEGRGGGGRSQPRAAGCILLALYGAAKGMKALIEA